MEKRSNRINVLTESIQENANTNFLHAVLNAIIKGYSDQTIFFDIIELARLEQISDGVLKTAPAFLRSYSKEFSNTLNFLAEKIEKISEFRDGTKIKKDKKDDDDDKKKIKDDDNDKYSDIKVVDDE